MKWEFVRDVALGVLAGLIILAVYGGFWVHSLLVTHHAVVVARF